MNSTSKILHLVDRLDWFDHAEQMRLLISDQKNAGQRVEVVAFAGERTECHALIEQGFACQIVRRRWSRDPFTVHQLTQIVGKSEPQIIHCWGAETAEFAAVLRWASPQSRIVATLEKPLPDRLFWIPGSMEAIDDLVTDAPVFPAKLVRPLRHIPPAIAPAPLSHSRDEFLARHDLSDDAKLIVTACTLERSQRLDEALWNFELVRTLTPTARYLIIGSGADQVRLQRYCQLVTDPSAVRFLHPRDWYPEAIVHADLYWHPGTGHGIPTGMLHAFASGVPVLANDQPALREVIRPCVNGMLVPTEDRAATTRHSVRLLDDTDESRALGEAGHQTFLQNYTCGHLVRGYEQHYGFLYKSSVA